MSVDMIKHIVEPHPETGINNGKLGIWLFLASEVMLFGALFSTYVLLRVGGDPQIWHDSIHHLNVPLATINTFVLIASSVTMVMAWAQLKFNSMGGFRLYMGLTIALSVVFMFIKGIEYGSKFGADLDMAWHIWDTLRVFMWGTIGFLALGGAFKALEVNSGESMLVKSDGLFFLSGFCLIGVIFMWAMQLGGFTSHGEPLFPSTNTFFATYFTMTALHGLHVMGGVVVNAYFLFFGWRMFKTEPDRFAGRIECAGLYWHFVDLVWIFLFPVVYLIPPVL